MSAETTYLDAMRDTAGRYDDGRGIRFYSTHTESTKLSYPELDLRARARAAQLSREGHRPGDVAVLAHNPGLGFVEAVYAAFYAGLVIAPVPVSASRNTEAAVARVAAIVADSESRLVLSEDAVLKTLDGLSSALGPGVQIVELSGDPVASDADAWTPPALTADSLAILQYTSGSTGTPKGVMVTHRNLVANQESIRAALGVGDEATWAGWLPHYHDMGLIGLLLHPIFAGQECVLTSPNQFLRRPALWLQMITAHRATITVAPDFAYDLCARLLSDAQLAELDLSSLRRVVTGAEPVRYSTLERFAARFASRGFSAESFVPAYGMAESTLLITLDAAEKPVEPIRANADELESGRIVVAGDADERSVDLVPCGITAPDHAVAIVDPATGARRPDGEVGEIWFSGPSVTLGYRGRVEETADVFGAVIAGEDDGARWLRTGDLGAIVGGQLVITGRIKDLIIVRGRNIYPQDLEHAAAALLVESPGSVGAAFEWPADPAGLALVLDVDARRIAEADPAALAERIRSRLVDEFTLPGLGIAFIRKGSLPRTTSGKVQRSLARRLLAENQLPLVHVDGLPSVEASRPVGAAGS